MLGLLGRELLSGLISLCTADPVRCCAQYALLFSVLIVLAAFPRAEYPVVVIGLCEVANKHWVATPLAVATLTVVVDSVAFELHSLTPFVKSGTKQTSSAPYRNRARSLVCFNPRISRHGYNRQPFALVRQHELPNADRPSTVSASQRYKMPNYRLCRLQSRHGR